MWGGAIHAAGTRGTPGRIFSISALLQNCTDFMSFLNTNPELWETWKATVLVLKILSAAGLCTFKLLCPHNCPIQEEINTSVN